MWNFGYCFHFDVPVLMDCALILDNIIPQDEVGCGTQDGTFV